MSDDDDFDGAPPRDAVVDRRGKRQVLATGFGMSFFLAYLLSAGFGKTAASSSYPAVARHEYEVDVAISPFPGRPDSLQVNIHHWHSVVAQSDSVISIVHQPASKGG
ncbi:hypothetical protein MY8738_009178 [Beauveria namnaoensis]